MRKEYVLGVIFVLFALPLNSALAQKKSEGEEKEKKKKKVYSEIITKEAITDSGLIITHKIGSKHYFEISKDLLEKELLIVSRIAGYVRNMSFGGAGMKSRPQQVVRFQQHDDKVLLRSVSYHSVADEDDPVYRSVQNNNFEPVIMSFDIKTYSVDSSAVVIEATPLFTTDVAMIGALRINQRKNFGIKSLDSKRSFVVHSRSFPKNVEIRHVLTYKGDKLPDNQLTQSLSVEMNQSIIMLPENPMQPRYHDARVGYFSVQRTNYSLDAQKAKNQRFITRWPLEPKDMDAFKRGELVEPVKPIIYYIDPATPEIWRKYIKQGVEDWIPAFEKAGFKNAIRAADPPTPEEDPDWSPEDVRYSVIRYITTNIQNAQGPHVHDPRTGEILESDILWYHNVMNLLRNWFFVQTSAINPDARGVKFKDEIMGRLIRFVSAHEVGHTLGLPHNMGSSVAYPVDSLRSATFTKKMGTAPSIMDYARFNYIAQPEDGDVGLMPNVGPYDHWAITYGYRPLPEVSSAEAERPLLNKMIKERAGNPLYRYGARNTIDASSQTEDLGDDPIKASLYGIANLKRIVPNLVKWSAEEGENYSSLNELYRQVVGQFNRYMGHVGNNVGGIYRYNKTSDEEGLVFTPVPPERQRAAVRFLNEQLFTTPYWLIDADIQRRTEFDGVLQRIRATQVNTLNRLFNADRLKRITETEALEGPKAYSITALFADVRNGIWSELNSKDPIDPYRRNLQRAFLDKMAELLTDKDDKYTQSDAKAVARGTLTQLKNDLKNASKRKKDTMTKFHLQDMLVRVEQLLNEDKK